MHELSLARATVSKIEALAREHNARRVVAARLRLDDLAGLSIDHLRDHFASLARGTVVQGARLDVVVDGASANTTVESIEIEE